MAILVDTQTLVWFGLGNRRISAVAAAAIADPDNAIYVSAVTAYEFSDLNRRGRFGFDLPLQDIVEALFADIIDFPALCWRIAEGLPHIHRDSVDRMLIAHAIHADLTLVTADKTMREYPVRSLW